MSSLKANSDIKNGISIIIPAFNEEESIGTVVKNLSHILEEEAFPYQIIVVDDGSNDSTAEIAEQLEGIDVIRHPHNIGYGAALKTGIRDALYDTICITDADATYPNECIPELVQIMMRGYNMVVGARIGKNVSIPIIRRPAKWVVRQFAVIVTGVEIPDINSGLRIFRRSIAKRFFRILPDGFSFTITITLAMITNGYRIKYHPIDYHPRVGHSKIKPIRDTLNFFLLIARIALYFAPLKVFLPLSAILVMISIGWAIWSFFAFGQIADVSTLVILMTAIQTAVIGFLAELINQRIPEFRDEDR